VPNLGTLFRIMRVGRVRAGLVHRVTQSGPVLFDALETRDVGVDKSYVSDHGVKLATLLGGDLFTRHDGGSIRHKFVSLFLQINDLQGEVLCAARKAARGGIGGARTSDLRLAEAFFTAVVLPLKAAPGGATATKL
jgi:hypothetical protein